MGPIVQCLADVLDVLRRRCDLDIPQSMSDWFEFDEPRMAIDVRRGHVVNDALKEARKPRFDCTKLLKVIMLCAL